jgi:hypothetical protein
MEFSWDSTAKGFWIFYLQGIEYKVDDLKGFCIRYNRVQACQGQMEFGFFI